MKKNPFSEIENLKITHRDEMSALKAELLEIKTVLKSALHGEPVPAPVNPYVNQNNDTSRRTFPRGPPRKCRKCFENNVYRCVHCFKCGSPQHRMAMCNQKNE